MTAAELLDEVWRDIDAEMRRVYALKDSGDPGWATTWTNLSLIRGKISKAWDEIVRDQS